MLKNISDQKLISGLEGLVRSERKITAEILEHIQEFDSRRLYLKFGHTSLFSYLTKSLGYTPAAAQRRIESARLMKSVPTLAKDIAEGSLNLSQLSLVAQSIKEASSSPKSQNNNDSATTCKKAELIEKIKNQDVASTQVIVAKELNIQPKKFEKKRLQQDLSLRLEITLSEEQQKLIQKARELLSHVNHNPSWAELFALLAADSIKMRDPLAKTARRTRATASVAPTRQERSETEQPNGGPTGPIAKPRKPIPANVKRHILNRDHGCQWRNPDGRKCESKFQLQFDHVVPVRNGGVNDPDNLQLLCGTHNRLKFRKETRNSWHIPGNST